MSTVTLAYITLAYASMAVYVFLYIIHRNKK